MPSNTPNLALYKKNPATDGADTFNIDTMLNENWDKIDTAGGASNILAKVKTVDGAGSGLDADLFDGAESALFARLASPALSGTPTAPNAAVGTNTTQIATTAFVSANAPLKTAADITLYVNAATGNDANNGIAAGTALKTIGAAIAKIPQVANHAVTINVAAGTYNEIVGLYGYTGNSPIIGIIGDTVTPANVKITAANMNNCSVPVQIRGFQATTTTQEGVSVVCCKQATVSNMLVDAASATMAGVYVEASFCRVNNCTVSNRAEGIYASWMSNVLSEINAGAGNTRALTAFYGATITKATAEQPAGTQAENTNWGGVIR